MEGSKPAAVQFLKRLGKNYFAVADAIFGVLGIALISADALIPAFELPPLVAALFFILLPLLLVVACYHIYSDDQVLIKSLRDQIKALEDVRANLHCTIEKVYFYSSCESSGSPFKRRTRRPGDITDEGLPLDGRLRVIMKIENTGWEKGMLGWEISDEGVMLPSIFDTQQREAYFRGSPRSIQVPPRENPQHEITIYIAVKDQDPQQFAKALHSAISADIEYLVVFTYWTEGVDVQPQQRELRIPVDFDNFYQDVIQYWESWFPELASLAQSPEGH